MGAFRRLVVDAYHFSRLVFLHGQKHIERFRVHTALAMDLYVYTVDEEDRIVCFQTAVQPLLDIFSQVVQHPRDARLAVVLSIDVIEDISDLLLCQTLAVQCAGKPLTLFLLIS